MDQHWQQPDRSTHGFGTLPGNSPPPGSWWDLRDTIMQSLARLEMGQILNRKAGDMRVADLRQHVDDRISDLRSEMRERIDRVEDQVATINTHSDAPSSEPASLQSAKVSAQAASASTPPAAASTPWWRDMSLREWALWGLVYLTALGVVSLDTLKWMLAAAPALLGGVGVK